MAANVESMFYVRKTPWHGLGIKVDEALTSKEALIAAGLNWNVGQKNVMTDYCNIIPGYRANIRESDGRVLGVVSDRYKIVQNVEAFTFTDNLLNHGVTYETAGSLQDGRKIWLLAKLPDSYKLADEKVDPYVVFSNSHDGTGAIKVSVTPIRIVCQNTLNLALSDAKRVWSMVHTGDIMMKLDEARQTLLLAGQYMGKLQREAEMLSMIKLSDRKVIQFTNELLPIRDEATELQKRNGERMREDLMTRYYEAPDLSVLPKNGWRFINAVSDFATHAEPLRKTVNFKENLFARTMEGHPLIDKATQLVREAC
jgi:phage/plasmid-like protein (TIGR03299 family)